jgi:hypothetical protein
MIQMKLKYLFPIVFCLHLSSSAQTYNHYFGNLHSHTGFSDGNKDSTTSGIARPDASYAYAKASQNFDFLGISEHNHFSSYKNPGFQLPSYQVGLNMANAANQDGSFLALFGIEFGVSSNFNGHVIVYGFNQLLGWETGNYDIYNGKTDYDGLFRKVRANTGSFCYLAHPYTTDYTTNGTAATALANSPYNVKYDSAIVGVPLRSGDAFSTVTNYTDYSAGNYFSYYTKLLSIGYHIGVGYDHDNHYSNFGRSNAGRLVILAPSLTRPNLITAMQNMNFYGSDDWNAKVRFEMNGNIMGSILSGSVMPNFNISHVDGDGETASIIKLWRGVSQSGISPQVVYYSPQNNTATFTEPSLTPGLQYYYFAEIIQTDGQWIVTSPIWYTSTAMSDVSIREIENLKITSLINPVSGDLDLTLSTVGDYSLTINDLSGRLVLEEKFYGNAIRKSLSMLEKGIYLMTIKDKTSTISKKIVIE